MIQYIFPINSAIFKVSCIFGDIVGTLGAGGSTGRVTFMFGINDGNSGNCGGGGRIGIFGKFKSLKNHKFKSIP